MGRKAASGPPASVTVPLWRHVDEKYLVEMGRYIDPRNVVPSSNVRSIRDAGVKLLYDSLREQGWSSEKGLRVKQLPRGPDGKKLYGCIDGMHRITAIQRLREEEERELSEMAEKDRQSKRYWTSLTVLANVYSHELPRSVEIQLAVEANWSTSVMVKTTIFDMLSAMAEIRRGLLAEHNAKVQGLAEEASAEGEQAEEEEGREDDEYEEEGVRAKKGRRGKKRGGNRKRAGNSKKKRMVGSPSIGILKNPSDVPIVWVSDAYYTGGVGSYAQPTVGTFCSLLYRFDNCPRSWDELERICNSAETEMAVNNSNLYVPEFSHELSDGMKFWILRRLCGEFKAYNKGVSKAKSKVLMAKQICLLREVEKLASIFKTNLLDFQWGSPELEEILRSGLENGKFDDEIPSTADERKKLNDNPATLIPSFDTLVENHHDAGRDALEGFHRENLEEVEEEGELEGDGEEGMEGAREEDGGRGPLGRKRGRSTTSRKKLKRRREDKDVPKWSSTGGTLRLFGQSFEDFLKSKEFENIKGQARLVLTDPPYNVFKGVDHDRITEGQMQEFANGAYEILCHGGCLLVFCTWQQLAPWYKILGDAGFLLCPTPMHVIMMRNTNKRSNFLQNIVEYVIYGIAKVARPGDSEVYLRWKGNSYINAKEPFPAYVNCMLHHPDAAERKLLTREDGKTAWRPQEKPLNLILELVKRFSPPNSIVVDLFAGTFTTAMAAKKLGRRFVGCEIDKELFRAAAKRLEEFCREEEPVPVAGSNDPEK